MHGVASEQEHLILKERGRHLEPLKVLTDLPMECISSSGRSWVPLFQTLVLRLVSCDKVCCLHNLSSTQKHTPDLLINGLLAPCLTQNMFSPYSLIHFPCLIASPEHRL